MFDKTKIESQTVPHLEFISDIETLQIFDPKKKRNIANLIKKYEIVTGIYCENRSLGAVSNRI